MLFINTFLFLFACLGNAALCVFNINYLYGSRYRGWWIKGLRHLHEVLILALPILFVWFYGEALWKNGDWFALPIPVLGFLAVCWYLCLVVSYQTVKRWFRQTPGLQLSNHTHFVDVAKELGNKPYGRGKYHFNLIARFPGNEIFQVDFVEKTLALPQLPDAWDGLTILQVSDLHLCGIPDRSYYEWIMDRCAKAPADILAVTGDILDSSKHYDWIAPVLSRLRWNLAAFAILGNHDAWLDVARISRHVEGVGIEMIGHRWVQREIKGQSMIIIGNEMPWLPPHPDLSDCPANAFRLCLSHTPDMLPWAKANRIDLMLAGHNHGGQVRLPGFGPVLVPSKFSRRYDVGLFHEPPTVMHVSRGLGGTYPLRWFCRPEVTKLILRRANS